MTNMNRKSTELVKFFMGLFLAVLVSAVLTFLPWIDLKEVLLLGKDLQFNLISTAATIGGFLFTGMSIFLTTIENRRVKRLWENHYLDNIYRVAIVGIICNVLTIIAALAMVVITMDEVIQFWFIRTEIFLILVSLIFFVWNVFDLVFVLSKMKKESTD